MIPDFLTTYACGSLSHVVVRIANLYRNAWINAARTVDYCTGTWILAFDYIYGLIVYFLSAQKMGTKEEASTLKLVSIWFHQVTLLS
jgi:hypothetical protein